MSRNDPNCDDREAYAVAKRTDSDMLDCVLHDLMRDYLEGRKDTALILLREAWYRGMESEGVQCWEMFDHNNFPLWDEKSYRASLETVRDDLMDMARDEITSG